MLKVAVKMALLVALASSCSIEEEMTRISVREAMRSELEAKKEVNVAREEMLEMKKELAWYSLHVAAAAACRGSTSSGGTGIAANSVLAKENTRSCDDQCADTVHTVCDADIAIQGNFGKATSYTSQVGYFYNYGCSTPGNTSVNFDEIKAEDDGVLKGTGIVYYRFCCCRKP